MKKTCFNDKLVPLKIRRDPTGTHVNLVDELVTDLHALFRRQAEAHARASKEGNAMFL